MKSIDRANLEASKPKGIGYHSDDKYFSLNPVRKDAKKITLTTIKNFIKRELKNNNLYIKCLSNFDGMVDCVMPVTDGFRHMDNSQTSYVENDKYTFGLKRGAWFVGGSRDSFDPFADDSYIGYKIYNCCGSFILAMKRLY